MGGTSVHRSVRFGLRQCRKFPASGNTQPLQAGETTPRSDDDESAAVAICGVTHALLQVPTLDLKNPDRLPNYVSIDRYYVMLRAFGTGPVYYLFLDCDRTAQ